MPDIDGLIGLIVGIFVIALLGYVFFTVLAALNGFVAFLFIVAIIVIGIALVIGFLRGTSFD